MFSPKKFPKKKNNAANESQNLKVKGSKRVQSKLYDSDESVRKALVEILIYIVFLVVTTIVANASHHLYMFYFNETLEKSFLERPLQTQFESEVSFDKMVTAADWWTYLEKNFLEELHGEHSKALGDSGTSSDTSNEEEEEEEKEEKEEEEEEEEEEKKEEEKKDDTKVDEKITTGTLRKFTRSINEDIKKYKRQLANKTEDDKDLIEEDIKKYKRQLANKTEDDEIGLDVGEDLIDENIKKDKRKVKNPDDKKKADVISLDAGEDLIDDDIAKQVMKDAKRRHLYLRDNILLGPPRMRQIRVKEGFCRVHKAFQTFFQSCYTGYYNAAENRTLMHKKTQYFTRKQLKVNRIRGEITTYTGAGYVKNLTFDHQHNIKIINKLKEDEWIDRGTRLVVLELVLFNTNAFMLNNVKIIAEILPVGGIVPSHQFQALKLHSIWTEGSLSLYVAGVLFYVMALCYNIVEIIQLVRLGPKLYFTSIWNILDIIVILLAYLSLAYSIIHPLYMKRLMTRANAHPENFVSIDYVCFWNLLFIDMMGVCVFLVWIKIFKFISFNKTMLQFSTTLKRCAKDLFGFAVMFFIVFLAYAQLGVLIFGTSHPDFREFRIAIITLMRMFLGDFEYQLIEEANHVLGPIYFLSYVLFVFFILLNMFLAIINDTYGAVKGEVSKGRSHLGSYLAKTFKKIFPCCFRKKKTTDISDIQSKANKDIAIRSTPSAFPSTSGRVHMTDSAVIREYFEELPESQQGASSSELAVINSNLKRINNRITHLEQVLEQLINNMDRILKVVEAKK